MTVQIAIIGLGQIGSSIGLALAAHSDKLTRLGHDREPTIAKKAQQLGAVDKIFTNLPATVAEADIVLLALPADEIQETLQAIAADLRGNTVIMDTAPVKQAAAEWMKELLPKDCHYVGLIPAINPSYLNQTESGIDGAHADLFTRGLMAIASPSGTAGEAVKLAADLSSLLGANPFFIDLAEVDGMMTSLHLMPQLFAATLANLVMDRPGWSDARKLGGRVYVEATAPVECNDSHSALVEAILQNKENVTRILDEMITRLVTLREHVSAEDRKPLIEWMQRASQGRAKWYKERTSSAWHATGVGNIDRDEASLGNRLLGNMGKWLKPKKPGTGQKEDT